MLKDITGKIVNEGDSVIILVKQYGYRKLSNAFLYKTTYNKKSQYGYEFGNAKNPFRIREPQVYKI